MNATRVGVSIDSGGQARRQTRHGVQPRRKKYPCRFRWSIHPKPACLSRYCSSTAALRTSSFVAVASRGGNGVLWVWLYRLEGDGPCGAPFSHLGRSSSHDACPIASSHRGFRRPQPAAPHRSRSIDRDDEISAAPLLTLLSPRVEGASGIQVSKQGACPAAAAPWHSRRTRARQHNRSAASSSSSDSPERRLQRPVD